MPLTKIVDNVVIELTAEEVAELEARQEAYDLDLGQVRAQRNAMLSGCDWTQIGDSPLTDEKKAEWVTYRQSLRDLPAAYSRVSEVVWPTPPG
jgi:hypothetical protein